MILAPYSLNEPLWTQFPPDKLWTYCQRKFERNYYLKQTIFQNARENKAVLTLVHRSGIEINSF